MGKGVGVIVWAAAEIAGVLARNPYADWPGNRVAAPFVDGPSRPTRSKAWPGQEQADALGARELFVLQPPLLGLRNADLGDNMADQPRIAGPIRSLCLKHVSKSKS
jgi:hypothetical protein